MTELLSAGRGKGGRCPRIPVFDSSAIGSFTPLRAQSPESDYFERPGLRTWLAGRLLLQHSKPCEAFLLIRRDQSISDALAYAKRIFYQISQRRDERRRIIQTRRHLKLFDTQFRRFFASFVIDLAQRFHVV
jgi:hypothetical protein